MKKVCIVIGSRANYGSIRSVMHEIHDDSSLALQLILNNSSLLEKYGEVSKLIEADGFRINYKIFNLLEGETPMTMAKSAGLALMELPSIFQTLNPDIIMTVGDRFETISTAVAASYMNIPLAHTMGGEVTGTIDESIRHAITKLSHIHFPASKDAALRLEKLGEKKSHIFNVGCPRIDLVKNILEKDEKLSNNEINKYGVGDKLNFNEPFIILSQHPVTTEFMLAEKQMTISLDVISKFKSQFLVLWPNADAGSAAVSKAIRKFRENNENKRIRFFKNLPSSLYINLLNKCSCIIGNSSSGIREGNFIGTPCVNIGTRQDGREKGENVLSVKHDFDQITKALRVQINAGKFKRGKLYGDGKAAKKITKVIKRLKKIDIQKKITY